MKHLLGIKELDAVIVDSLMQRALALKHKASAQNLASYPLANLFYESSTRTRVSFELAARALSMPVVNFDIQHSSENKGECIEDTVSCLAAMGVRIIVIRHTQSELPHALAQKCSAKVHVVNAGDGQHEHPSQALLDLMTIVEHKPNLQQLKIAVVGDIRHSRVANSLQYIAALCNVGQLVFVAPTIWQPQTLHYGELTTSLQDGLRDADVVMTLRVQHERLLESEHLDLDEYRRAYMITPDILSLARPDAIIMHPGPVNRGVEIASAVADGPQSMILTQVQNGVFMRMAILEAVK